jgi:hypothetical protein
MSASFKEMQELLAYISASRELTVGSPARRCSHC